MKIITINVVKRHLELIERFKLMGITPSRSEFIRHAIGFYIYHILKNESIISDVLKVDLEIDNIMKEYDYTKKEPKEGEIKIDKDNKISEYKNGEWKQLYKIVGNNYSR